MLFEWDEEKNTKNKKKHGISFEFSPFSRMNMRFCLMIRIILKKKIGF